MKLLPNFRGPFLATIIVGVLITFLLSETNAVVLSSSFCSDPTTDVCLLTLSFTRQEVDSSAVLRITNTSWLSATSSVSNPGCELSSSALTISPKAITVSDTMTTVNVVCRLNLVPGVRVDSLLDPSSDLLLPNVVYYKYPFEITPLTESCTLSSRTDDCRLRFRFPASSLPFNFDSTSTLLSGATCSAGTATNNVIVFGTPSVAGLVRTVRLSAGSGLIVDPVNDTQVSCQLEVTKHVVSPYLKISTVSTNANSNFVLYSSQSVLYSDLSIYLGADCANELTNSCTLVYSINNAIPSYADLQVSSLGFAQRLTKPAVCAESVLSTASMGPVDTSRIYLCQKWRKHLQFQGSSTWQGITIPRTAAITTDKLVFTGTYFMGIQTTIPTPWQISYISPIWMDFEQCDVTSFVCRVSIRSTYTGPAISAAINLPYSGVIQASLTKCNDLATFNHDTKLFQVPGGKSTAVFAPHPDDVGVTYHYCDLYIARNPGEAYPATKTELIRYQESGSKFISSMFIAAADLHPTAFTAPAIVALTQLPITFQPSSDCLDPDDYECTVVIKATDNTIPILPFQISFPGALSGIGGDDTRMWRAEIVNKQTSYGQLSVVASQSPYSAKQPLPSYVNPCRISTSTTTCVNETPNDPAAPCTPCDDTVWLFSFTFTGPVTNNIKFTYRKQLRTRWYEDIVRVYSYGQYTFPYRVDSGRAFRLANPTSPPQLVSVSDPQFTIVFNSDCAHPGVLQCSATVTRRSLDDVSLYFIAETSNVIMRYALLGTVMIEGLEVTHWDLTADSYTGQINIPIQFDKRAGANGELTLTEYPVNKAADGTLTFGRRAITYIVAAVYSHDAFPVYEEDCSSIASPYCTSSYTLNSLILIMDAVLRARTIIKHLIHDSDYIYSLQFHKTGTTPPEIDATDPEYAEVLSAEEIANPNLKIYIAECENMPGGKTLLLWDPSVVQADGTTRGTIEFRLIAGIIYGLAVVPSVCPLVFVKRFSQVPSPRIRDFPINMYDDFPPEWLARTDAQLVRVPPFHHNRMTVLSEDDCVTQNTVQTVCTIQFDFYGSPEYPIKTLSQFIPSFFSHPLSPPGSYYLVHSLTVPVAQRRILGSLIISDDPTQTDPNKKRELVFSITDPASQIKHTSTYLIATAAITPVAYPYSSFSLNVVPNREFPVDYPNLPTIWYPPTLTGILATIGANSTYARASTYNWVRIEYTFQYPIDYIIIDSNFDIPEENKLPCYKTNPRGEFIDKARYDLRYNHTNKDLGSDTFHIWAWLHTDPVTKQTHLTPAVWDRQQLAPPITTSVFSPRTPTTCYIYYQMNQIFPSKTDNVHHTIGARAFTDLGNGGSIYQYHYYASYPSYSIPSVIVPIDSTSNSNQNAENSAVPPIQTPLLILLGITLIALGW